MEKSLKCKLFLLLLTLLSCKVVYGCNEAVCASIVSKCLLTNSCNCSIDTCECCKQCFECLSYLYNECCTCFGLCPDQRKIQYSLYQDSVVGNLNESLPKLFERLTEEPDIQKRWISFKYKKEVYEVFEGQGESIQRNTRPDAKEYSYSTAKDKENQKNKAASYKRQKNTVKLTAEVNCTVAYMSECQSQNKCRRSCESIGASSYRWFFDGCCECVQEGCYYGLSESKCMRCPLISVFQPNEEAIHYLKNTFPQLYDDYGQDEDDNVICDKSVSAC